MAVRKKKVTTKVRKLNRNSIWVCKDGTRTCPAVMSSSHIAYSLGLLLRNEGETFGPTLVSSLSTDRPDFVPVFIEELNRRLAKNQL